MPQQEYLLAAASDAHLRLPPFLPLCIPDGGRAVVGCRRGGGRASPCSCGRSGSCSPAQGAGHARTCVSTQLSASHLQCVAMARRIVPSKLKGTRYAAQGRIFKQYLTCMRRWLLCHQICSRCQIYHPMMTPAAILSTGCLLSGHNQQGLLHMPLFKPQHASRTCNANTLIIL